MEIISGMALIHSRLFFLIQRINDLNHNIPILMYHSIDGNGSDKNIPSCLELYGMVVPLSVFERHMEFIAKYYNVISLDYMMECLSEKGIGLPNNPLVITFDDGFKNNYQFAFPILKEKQFPATIFLIGDTFRKSSLIWLHRLYHLIDHAPDGCFSIHYNCNEYSYRINKKNKKKVIKEIISHFNRMSSKEKMDFLDKLEEQNKIENKTENYYLDTVMIKTMMKNGISFGAHSMRHNNMALLDNLQMENEIIESKRLIQEITGKKKFRSLIPMAQ